MVQVVFFWVIAALLAGSAAALLFLALRARRARGSGPDINQANAAVYESRLEELQAEVDEGTLDPEDYEQAKVELERELLASIRGEDTSPATTPPRGAAIAVAVVIPVLAVAIYLQLGSPQVIGEKQPAPRDAAASMESLGDREALRRMTESFAENLRQNPEQGGNWLVLARAYVMLEDYPKAVNAFRHANILLGDAPEVLVDYAEAEALANGNRFSDAARGRIEKALNLDPENEKGLWLGAFAAAQHGDADVAVSRWERLRARGDNPDRARIIDGLIARVQGAAQSPPPSGAESQQAGAARVRVRVALADTLSGGLSGTETVFVLARAPNGPRMPLAVFRTTVAALPASITLDDSLAMAPAFKISSQDQVMVIARVSISGDASARSGDLQGEAGPVPVGDETPVEIVIDQRIP